MTGASSVRIRNGADGQVLLRGRPPVRIDGCEPGSRPRNRFKLQENPDPQSRHVKPQGRESSQPSIHASRRPLSRVPQVGRPALQTASRGSDPKARHKAMRSQVAITGFALSAGGFEPGFRKGVPERETDAQRDA